jgi:hypothetical protein
MTTKTLGLYLQHWHTHQDEKKKNKESMVRKKKGNKGVGKVKGEMMKTTYM